MFKLIYTNKLTTQPVEFYGYGYFDYDKVELVLIKFEVVNGEIYTVDYPIESIERVESNPYFEKVKGDVKKYTV